MRAFESNLQMRRMGRGEREERWFEVAGIKEQAKLEISIHY